MGIGWVSACFRRCLPAYFAAGMCVGLGRTGGRLLRFEPSPAGEFRCGLLQCEYVALRESRQSMATHRPWLLVVACASVVLCQRCLDEHEDCFEWAVDGECKRNSKWMKVNCRRSCGKCSSDEVADDLLAEGAYTARLGRLESPTGKLHTKESTLLEAALKCNRTKRCRGFSFQVRTPAAPAAPLRLSRASAHPAGARQRGKSIRREHGASIDRVAGLVRDRQRDGWVDQHSQGHRWPM